METASVLIPTWGNTNKRLFAPGPQLQLRPLWHSCLAAKWQLAQIPRIWRPSACEHKRAHTYKFAYVFYCFDGPVAFSVNGRPCAWGDERRDACGRALGYLRGYWVDCCPPFVHQIRGNLQAIVAPCLSTSQRAERGDFSCAEPMTSRFSFFLVLSGFLSCSFILFVFSCCLFALFWMQSAPRSAIVL